MDAATIENLKFVLGRTSPANAKCLLPRLTSDAIEQFLQHICDPVGLADRLESTHPPIKYLIHFLESGVVPTDRFDALFDQEPWRSDRNTQLLRCRFKDTLHQAQKLMADSIYQRVVYRYPLPIHPFWRLLLVPQDCFHTPLTDDEYLDLLRQDDLSWFWPHAFVYIGDQVTKQNLASFVRIMLHARHTNRVLFALTLSGHTYLHEGTQQQKSALHFAIDLDDIESFGRIYACPDDIAAPEPHYSADKIISPQFRDLLDSIALDPERARRLLRIRLTDTYAAETTFVLLAQAEQTARESCTESPDPVERFYRIFCALPTELQMQICVPLGDFPQPYLRDKRLTIAAKMIAH